MPAARWRSQLSRRTTVLHRKREVSRRYSALFVVCRLIRTSAARRALAARSRDLPPPERQPAKRRASASVTRKPAKCWGPQFARRATVLHRRREASRRCSALLYRIGRSRSARHGVRAQQARLFCHLPRDIQRGGACASVARKPAACWRSQLAGRTKVLHRRKEASRRCSALHVA